MISHNKSDIHTDVSIPDLHCVVNKRKEGGQGKGTGEHCDEPELDDHLEVLGDDHGRPGGGQEEVLEMLSREHPPSRFGESVGCLLPKRDIRLKIEFHHV